MHEEVSYIWIFSDTHTVTDDDCESLPPLLLLLSSDSLF